MLRKSTSEQKHEWARPRWALSMDDAGSIALVVAGYVLALGAPTIAVAKVVDMFWPEAPPDALFYYLAGTAAIAAAFLGLYVFHRIVKGRFLRWLQTREIPEDEELQDRLETAAQELNQ